MIFFSAMARVTMARAAVSMRPSAHSPLDNVSTKYNPIRLLKGAPPGQVITVSNHSNVMLLNEYPFMYSAGNFCFNKGLCMI